jgi:branched-chain amino acid transport system ATP-binding protein
MEEALLKVKNLSVDFGGFRAINKMSLDVVPGEISGLIGPNGAGKTTFFNVISRFQDPIEGEIYCQGKNLLSVSPHQIVEWGISRTFQNILIFPRLTVIENVMVGIHSKINSNFILTGFGFQMYGEKKARKKSLDVLSFLGIEKLANKFPQHLSLGQQKLVEIGRAIVSEPKLLLLDEPAGGMNNIEIERMKTLLNEIRSKMGITILLIEHVMRLVMSICDRVTVIYHGIKIANGSPKEISRNAEVLKVYLGERDNDIKPSRH